MVHRSTMTTLLYQIANLEQGIAHTGIPLTGAPKLAHTVIDRKPDALQRNIQLGRQISAMGVAEQ